MPRYKFITHVGDTDQDEIELELEDETQAKREARKAVTDLAREQVVLGGRLFCCRVVDEEGHVLTEAELTFSEG